MSHIKTPILIVGAGPVGLALALFLDFWDTPCTIINTGAQSRRSPKGNTNNARTMEIFRQIGIVDDIRRVGLPSDYPCDACFFTRFSKHEIHRHHMPSLDERLEMRAKASAIDQYVEPMYRANHMYVEQVLFDKVQASKLVDTRFGCEAIAFTQTNADVTVSTKRFEDDETVTFTADYVVDCSGGRSLIRKGLGIHYTGDAQIEHAYMDGQFLNAWVRIPDLYKVAPALKTSWFNLTVNSDKSTRGILAALNGRDEFILITKAGQGERMFNTDDIIGMIRRMTGHDTLHIEVLSHSPWNAGAARTAERYQNGRIYLAGDAVHLFKPVGGFGMNTGIDDAHNLAWKLAAVYHGWGGDTLLGSYENERKPIGIRNTNTCQRSSSTWIEPQITDSLELDGPDGDKARLEMAKQSYVVNMHFLVPEQDDYTGVQLGSRYDASPLIIPDGEAPTDSWPSTFATYTPTSLPGGRLPHLWLDDAHVGGASIYDRLGNGFTLVRVQAPMLNVGALLTLAESRGIPLCLLDVTRPEARGLYGQKLLLVRPDRYIAWRGDALPQHCEELLSRICGWS